MARKILGIFAVLVFLVACTDKAQEQTSVNIPEPEKQSETTEPAEQNKTVAASAQAMEFSLVPKEAGSKTVLEARARGFSLDDTTVVWMQNGTPVSTPRIQFFDSPEMDVRKGDTVQAVATVDGVEISSNVVTIVNSKPELKHVTITPAEFAPGQNVGLDVEAFDADGDEVRLEYAWTVNDHQAGIGSELDETLSRGDSFTVTVTPFDGEESGKSITLHRKVGNLPPRIEANADYTFDGNVYVYQVKAFDPDGDPLSFFIKSGPEGMTINPTTGEVRWTVPDDFQGTAQYEVAVSDGQGGEARYSMSYAVSE